MKPSNNNMKNLPIYILCFIAIILSGIAISCQIKELSITNFSIILGFIGILVTIIVLGNIAQIHAIKSDMEKEMKILKEQQNVSMEMINNIISNYDHEKQQSRNKDVNDKSKKKKQPDGRRRDIKHSEKTSN